jgi:hypothetical protein
LFILIPYAPRFFDMLAHILLSKRNLHQDDTGFRSLRRWRHPRPLFYDQFCGLEAFLLPFIRAVADAYEAVTILRKEFFRATVPRLDGCAGVHGSGSFFV